MVVFGACGSVASGGERDAGSYRVVGWTKYAGAGPYTGNDPEVSAADLVVYADLLDLDETQVELMVLAHEGYVEAYGGHWVEWAEGASDAQAARAARLVSAAKQGLWLGTSDDEEAAAERFAEAVRGEREVFHDEIRLLLRSEQERDWVRVERYLRRATFFGDARGHGPSGPPAELVDALGVLRSVRKELGGGDAMAGLESGALAVVRGYEGALDGLISAHGDARERLKVAVERYEDGGSDGDEGDWEALQAGVVGAALGVRRSEEALIASTARFERELRSSVGGEVAEAFSARMAELAARAALGVRLQSEEGATRFAQILSALESSLSDAQRGEVEAIDGRRRAEREEVLDAFAPLLERERERRAARDDAEAPDTFEANYLNGGVRLQAIDADEPDRSVLDDPDAEERGRLAVRLYEIEQRAVDELRPLLSKAQRMRIARR